MLTYEALLDQAKQAGMPSNKLRGILREYLQILILKELYKTAAGRKLFFTGGTYLRLVCGLKRFSEDLDFNTSSIHKKEFEELLNKVQNELKRSNISAKTRFKHWKNIYSADLIFPDIEKVYGVRSRYSKASGIVIKIETNRPKWRIKKETNVISGFGELYPAVCTARAALFADKIDALCKKTRARHLYDIIFMLSSDYPIDKRVLKSLGIKEEPMGVIVKRVKGFSKAELKRQAETLRPFLFEETEADLIIKAHEVIPPLVEKYVRQSSKL